MRLIKCKASKTQLKILKTITTQTPSARVVEINIIITFGEIAQNAIARDLRNNYNPNPLSLLSPLIINFISRLLLPIAERILPI